MPDRALLQDVRDWIAGPDPMQPSSTQRDLLLARLDAALAAPASPGCEVCGHVPGAQQTGPRSEWRVRYEAFRPLVRALVAAVQGYFRHAVECSRCDKGDDTCEVEHGLGRGITHALQSLVAAWPEVGGPA